MRAKPSSGYSLIEVMIVMLVIGILAAATAPKYLNALSKFRLNSTTRRIVGDLKLAQREAKRTSSNRIVVYDVGQNKYQLTGVNDWDHPGTTYRFELGQADYQTTLLSAVFGSGSTLTFDIYGRPNVVGTVKIRSGNYSQTVHVDSDGMITRSNIVPFNG